MGSKTALKSRQHRRVAKTARPKQRPDRIVATAGPAALKRRHPRIVATAGPAAPKRRRARIVATAGPAASKRRRARIVAKAGGLTVSEVAELKQLRRQLERGSAGRSPLRWNADPDEVRRSVGRLVLTLVEFIRKLLERQAIRRMDAGTLTKQQIEDVGRALMRLEDTIGELASAFGISPDDLNLDLGPVGRLL